MENSCIKNKNLVLLLLASIYLAVYSLLKIVNVLQRIFMPYQLERVDFFGIIYRLFYVNINYWHLFALASCGIIFVNILSTVVKKNSVNKMIFLQNRILLIFLIVLSGIRIFKLINIIFGVFKGVKNNFADIVRIEPIKARIISIIWTFESTFFSFLILVGIILFAIVMLKKITTEKLKKTALYFSLAVTTGSFAARIINFILSLQFKINLFTQQELFGLTTGQIVLQTLEEAVLILIPVATFVIIYFGLKYTEYLKEP